MPIIKGKFMKKISWLIFVIMFNYFQTNLIAQERGIGVGLILGEPTGISAKYWVNNNNAFDFALAYSFVGNDNSFALHANYLYHLFNVIQSEYTLPIYYGFGGRFRAQEDSQVGLGIRGVSGILFFSDRLPLDFFFEIAPVFELIPSTELDIDIGLGARYFLN